MKRHSLTRCLFFLGAAALLPALPLTVSVQYPAVLPALSPVQSSISFRDFSSKDPLTLLPSSIPPEVSEQPEESQTVSAAASDPEVSLPEVLQESSATLSLPQHYTVLDAETGEVLSLTPFEYICGVTAAEIPIGFHTEALKAQAVAAHSYALYQMGLQLKNPDPDLKGAILSTDPAHFQAYLSETERQSLWGEAFSQNEEKLRAAVEEVLGCVLVYEGQPLAAAFHSISSGRTESAADVWGQSLPCLVPADSPEDTQNPQMLSRITLTLQEVSATLGANLDGLSLSDDPNQWFAVTRRTESGMVLEIQVGNLTTDGEQIRSLFDLPSANFEISYQEENFLFTVKGRGHGVGMSQYGADSMANNGKSWKEIVARYYPGAEIATVLS
ncbi:MAG: stage II sporulation protein D [Candidatus Merdivicinus sp.]|jgi:stage II sporulation protein D